MRSRRSRRRTAATRGRILRSRRRSARSVMARDADIHPEVTVPPPAERAPEAERAVESRPAGALVPTDALQRYLAEIRRIPVLSREEEHELAVRWHEHEDRQAAWRLVTANLRLVVMIPREYQPPFPKLIAERLDVREREVVEMEQRLAARDVSVDAPLGEEEDATLLDFLPSREQTADAVADEEYHRLVRRTANEFQKTLKGKDLVIY